MKKTLLLLLLSLPYCSFGQDEKTVDALYADFSIPDASAITVLGIAPDKVTRPTSPKELAASLQNIATNGANIPALALEWVPGLTFNRLTVRNTPVYTSYEQYRKTRIWRALAFSLADVQDTSGTRIAFGVNACLIDKTDFSYDLEYRTRVLTLAKQQLYGGDAYNDVKDDYLMYRKEIFNAFGLNDAEESLLDASEFEDSSSKSELPARDRLREDFMDLIAKKGADVNDAKNKKMVEDLLDTYYSALKLYRDMEDSDDTIFSKLIAEEKKEFKRKHWNDWVLKVGAGNIWASSANTWKGLQAQKASAYLSLAFPLWKQKGIFSGQGILLLQGGHNYNAADENTSQFTGGARAVLGSNKVHGSLEFVYQSQSFKKTEAQPAAKDNLETLRSTIGLEVRMSDGLWVELATGISGDSKDFSKNAGMIGIGSLKYTFKKEDRYKIE